MYLLNLPGLHRKMNCIMFVYRLDLWHNPGMETLLNTDGQNTWIETLPGSGLLASEADAMDLISACGEYQVNRLLINQENIPKAFYDLRTGLAGSVLLKLSTYRIKAGAVVNSLLSKKEKFYDFALETNRGNDFRVFQTRAQALTWLLEE